MRATLDWVSYMSLPPDLVRSGCISVSGIKRPPRESPREPQRQRTCDGLRNEKESGACHDLRQMLYGIYLLKAPPPPLGISFLQMSFSLHGGD